MVENLSTDSTCMEVPVENSRNILPIDDGILEDLPLTPFEQFMVCDDRPDSPAMYYVRFQFDGEIDPVVLRNSIVFAIKRHPLLSARIIKKSGRLYWTFSNDESLSFEAIQDSEWDCPDFLPAIDLYREAGLRVKYGVSGGKSVIWFQFHHACCDGQGARQFTVFDILTAYARETSNKKPAWERYDTERLKNRAIFPRLKSTIRTSIREKLKYAFDFHATRLSPVAASKSDKIEKEFSSEILLKYHEFTPEDSLTIKDATQRAGVTVNDLAVTLLFQTLAEWNEEHGVVAGKKALRLLIPVDLRTREDRFTPATNRLGFSFLTRQMDECKDRSSLLSGVHDEMSYVKQSRVAMDFLDNIRVPLSIPGAMSAFLRFSRCLATAVITNVDDPSRRIRRRFPLKNGRMVVGNLTLEQIFAVPPVRTGTSIGIGICRYAGQLTIGLLADRRCFDDSTAEEILGRYVDSWQQWLAEIGLFDQQENKVKVA